MNEVEQNKHTARRYVEELWSEGRLEVADEIISTPAGDRSSQDGSISAGPDTVKAMVAGLRSLLSGVSREMHSMTAEGEYVAINSTLSGIHDGSWGPIPYPPTGERISISGHAVFQFENGQIVDEPWSNWNLSDRTQQNAAAIVRRQAAAACVRKYVADVWNGADTGSADALLSPDIRLSMPWSDGEITGADAVKAAIAKFRSDNPGLSMESAVATNHDSGEMVFRTWRATNVDGPSIGVAMTRFENGRIVEDRICS